MFTVFQERHFLSVTILVGEGMNKNYIRNGLDSKIYI